MCDVFFYEIDIIIRTLLLLLSHATYLFKRKQIGCVSLLCDVTASEPCALLIPSLQLVTQSSILSMAKAVLVNSIRVISVFPSYYSASISSIYKITGIELELHTFKKWTILLHVV